MPSRKTPHTKPPTTPHRAKAGKRAPLSLKFSRILVPLDFSGKSRQALDTAIPLAERHGGKIILMHVVEFTYVTGAPEVPYVPPSIGSRVEAATTRLNRMAKELVPPALLDRVLVRHGSPMTEITAAARRAKADLIIIASKGRTGLKRILLGSTAESVVRHAPCAVLTVRRH